MTNTKSEEKITKKELYHGGMKFLLVILNSMLLYVFSHFSGTLKSLENTVSELNTTMVEVVVTNKILTKSHADHEIRLRTLEKSSTRFDAINNRASGYRK